MKVITELKDVVKIKRFGSNILDNYSSDGILLGYNKDGLCTLISMKDFSYIYPGKWFREWKNFKNNDNIYIVTNSDNLKTLINKKDGSFVYNNSWYANWNSFKLGHEYYEVHLNNKVNFLRKDNGDLLFKNFVPNENIICYDYKNHRIFVLDDEKVCMYEA